MRTPLFVFRLRKALRPGGTGRRVLSIAAAVTLAAVLAAILSGRLAHPPELAAPSSSEAAPARSEPAPAVPDKREERMQAAIVAEQRLRPGAELTAASPFEILPLRSIDGTSFRHGDDIVRLAGVEGPGAGDVCRDGEIRWSCGLQARAALHNLVAGRGLTCRPRKVLADGVLSADCDLPPRGSLPSGGLARLLVLQGWARPVAGTEAALGEAVAQARKERSGLWRGDWAIIAAAR